MAALVPGAVQGTRNSFKTQPSVLRDVTVFLDKKEVLMAKNVIIGQSGGPTAVINSSLAGVYKAAISLGAEKVYGMQYGIEGLLKEEMLELNVLLNDRMSIELLKRPPSSYLGSCRYKLPDPDVDAAPFVKLFTLFDKYAYCIDTQFLQDHHEQA